MNPDPYPASQAIQNAYQALKSGDRQAARRWAEQAATLAPHLEEPWLLLAAVSRSQSRLQYLQRALQVNPNSARAKAGIEQTQKQIAAGRQQTASTDLRAKGKHLRRPRTAVWVLVLALALTGTAIWGSVSSAQAVFASPPTAAPNRSWQQVEVAKPTYTPSPVPTATQTPMPTITPTESPPEVAPQETDSESEPPKPVAGAVYTVQRGDTLGQIAGRFGVPVAEIAAANHLTDPSSIYAGQELIIPGLEFIPAQPASGGGPKHILVDISEQHLYAYEGDTLVYSFVASTGMNNATAIGTFSVLNKIPSAYGSTWNIWMPYWLGIYWSGGLQNGIHALPILPGGGRLWAGYLGRPISYGCVVLGEYEAQLLYEWAEIGTPVVIQW